MSNRQWSSFTKKLRELMKENPSLRVVVSLPNGTTDREVTCVLGFACDRKPGKAAEKVILICENTKLKDPFLDIDDDELPF